MWESIGLLLVYLVSGYLNKRKKEQKNSDLEKQQESSEKLIEDKGFDELLINFFKDDNSSNTLEPEVLEDGELDGEAYIDDQNNIEKIEGKELYKDEETLKAAIAFKNAGLGIPLIIAKEEIIKKKLNEIGYSENLNIEIINAKKNKALQNK